MWCVGDNPDDEYIEKMEDVLSVYERPYSAAHPVVCLDEKPVSLHADVRPARPMVPGRASGGTTNINVTEPPIFSQWWNPKQVGTLPAPLRSIRPSVRAPWSGTSLPLIPPPAPFIL